MIPGGADINPDYYLDSVDEQLKEHTRKLDHLVVYTTEGRERDPFEYNLLKKWLLAPAEQYGCRA